METPNVPGEGDQIVVALYDSYIKAVLRNRSRTLQKRYYRRAGRESLVADPTQYLDTQALSMDWLVDKSVISIEGLHCEVSDDLMYQALMSLPPTLLLVVIMWYWKAQKTQEIASYFGVSSRTILNWHNKAINLLRERLRRVGENDAT